MPAAVQGARPSAGALGCRGGCRAHHEGAPCATGLLVEEVRSAGCSRWLADVEQAASTCCLGAQESCARRSTAVTTSSNSSERRRHTTRPKVNPSWQSTPWWRKVCRSAALSAQVPEMRVLRFPTFQKAQLSRNRPALFAAQCRPKPGWRPSRPDRLQRLRQLQQPERLRRLRRLQRLRQPGQPPLRSRLR